MIVASPWIPRGFAALTVWPFIFVLREHRDDAGLIEHEMVHYREQRGVRMPWWMARYLVSKTFRRDAEVRAYRRQIEIGGISEDNAVLWLLTYRLDETADQLRTLLRA